MKFGIVCKFDDLNSLALLKNILEILRIRKHKYVLESELSKHLKLKVENADIENMHANIILVVGDDSTILRTFRDMKTKSTPVLGIGSGDASFLSECDVNQFPQLLRKMENKNYFVDKRARLQIDVNGKTLPHALNELVISASRGATLLRYTLKVDEEVIWRDSADGIIVSTPTGSTGYSLSVGGPIVSSSSGIFLITPIASINQNKPFVVSNSSTIEISDIFSSAGCEAIIDGRFRIKLENNLVKIKNSKLPAKFIRMEKRSYANIFNRLRKRAEAVNIPKNAPPSSKFIYKILQYEGALTQKEIINLSMLPPRTVRSALDYLVKNGLVMVQTSVRDTRQSIYFVE